MQANQNMSLLLQFCKHYLHQEDIVLDENPPKCASLYTLAKQHRITMPLTPDLLEWFKSSNELETENSLKEYNQKVKMNMLKLTHETMQLLQLFEEQKLFCFCLKGPVCAQQIFGDYTAKDSRDIDLLIDESKLETYIEMVQKRGYSPIFDYQQLNTKQKQYFRKVNNQLVFFHKENRILLEIHWRLFANEDLLSFSDKDLKLNSKTITVATQPILVFSDEHLLFYLIAHGAKHKWYKLYWLLEITVLIKRVNFNWTSVLLKAKKAGIERMLFQSIILIEELFDIEVPLDFEKDKKVLELVDEAKNGIFNLSDSSSNKGIKSYWSTLKYKMKLKNSLKYKLNYFHFISVRDFKLLPLPESLFGLYYICRPFLWTKRYLIK